MDFKKWGLKIGKLLICWYDLWSKHFMLEVSWSGKVIFNWKFKNYNPDYVYKFKIWVEVKNELLHIIFAIGFTHVFLAYMPLLTSMTILFVLGCIREIWQNLRGKIQPWWISLIDALSFSVGGYIWWWIIHYFNINVDALKVLSMAVF